MDALNALAADGPDPNYPDALMLFGRFVGDWELKGELIDGDDRRAFQGNDIVLEGHGSAAGERLRWSFEEIEPDRFTWRGHLSTDGGTTWTLREEMRLSRRGAGREAAVTLADPAVRAHRR